MSNCEQPNGLDASTLRDAMQIRLTLKLAECLDGIDVSSHSEGDVFDLCRGDAEMLIAEHWAVPIDNALGTHVRGFSSTSARAVAEHSVKRPGRTIKQLREVRRLMDEGTFAQREHRRAEDLI